VFSGETHINPAVDTAVLWGTATSLAEEPSGVALVDEHLRLVPASHAITR
jgi:hypothetical protein